jgi:hypothetical protein
MDEGDGQGVIPTYTTIDHLDAALERVRELERANEYLHAELQAARAAFAACLPSRALTEQEKSDAGEIDDRDILTAFSAAERLRSLAPEHPAIERFVRRCEENGVIAALEAHEKEPQS